MRVRNAVMRRRWIQLWQRIDTAGAVGRPGEVLLYEELKTEYSHKKRAHHNLVHIDEGLTDLARARHVAKRPDEVAFAFWYHDFVYEPDRTDNEEKSAEAAQYVANAAGLSHAFRLRVHNLILATRHDQPPHTPDEALIMDIDLAILGQDRRRFDQYERAIRKEYDGVPPKKYARERMKILNRFLRQRQSIYHTAYFQRRYGASAHRNLLCSIAALKLQTE